MYRILKRWFKRKLGLEKGSYKQTFAMLKQLYIWNSLFEKQKLVILEKLSKCNATVIIINKKSYNRII